MHLTNGLGYRNRYHPWYPAPFSVEVRTFQVDVERVERSKRLLTERAGAPGRQPKPHRQSGQARSVILRLMLDALRWSSAGRPHHHIRLNLEFRSDLQLWRKLILGWNVVSVWEDHISR